MLKKIICLGVILITCLVLFVGCSIEHNAVLFDNAGEWMHEDFLKDNWVKDAKPPMEWQESIPDQELLPEYRIHIVENTNKFDEIFDKFPPCVDFDTEILVVYITTNIYMGRSYKIKDLSLDDGILSVNLKKENKLFSHDASTPGQRRRSNRTKSAVRTDGRGYSLKDYGIKYVGDSGSSYQYYSILFHTVSGVIRNLDIKNVTIPSFQTTAQCQFGFLTHTISNGLIESININGKLKSIDNVMHDNSLTFASIANGISGIATINNCINNIDIDSEKFTTSTSTYVSGIVRDVSTGYFIVSNCINNGNITSLFRTAGIVSYVYNSTLLLENNLNTGTIKSTSTTSDANASAGGILANLNTGTVTFKNNTNLGNIENNGIGTNVGAGGIIGSMLYSTTTAFLYNNTNSGNITANATTEGNAGGIIGYVHNNSTTSLFNNTNTGIIESKGIYAGGAIGRATAGSTITLDGNLNYGKVSKESL